MPVIGRVVGDNVNRVVKNLEAIFSDFDHYRLTVGYRIMKRCKAVNFFDSCGMSGTPRPDEIFQNRE